jgi:hypothetical protein
MNTVIRDWFFVSVYEADFLKGNVLFGYVVYDSSFRFLKDDFVCTSNIIHINKSNQLITTQSGSLYQILDKGHRSTVYYEEFELLRNGFSPLHIEALRMSATLKIH